MIIRGLSSSRIAGGHMYRVLVVEDDRELQEIWREVIDPSIEIFRAHTVEEAETQFAAHPDVDAIVMDGMLEVGMVTRVTLDLISRLRLVFPGPIIATSNHDSLKEEMMERGCTMRTTKHQLPKALHTLFGVKVE